MVTRSKPAESAQQTASSIGDAVLRAVGGVLNPAGERMSKVDTAWFRMDNPSNLMMIVGVWVLKPGVTHAAVCERVQERLLQYPRFSQRVVEDAMGATWVMDQQFDLRHHVVVEHLPKKPKGRAQEALQDRMAQLASTPLDHRRPLWQFHLVEHYQGGSALMVRIHHCIADGIALISVMQSLVDGGMAPPVAKKSDANQHWQASAQDWLQSNVFAPFAKVAAQAMGATVGNDVGMLAYRLARDSAALALMADDSPTRLKGKPGKTKKVAWCPPLPLADVRAVGKALNCSINDVLMSCVAGAIGQYLIAKGDKLEGKEIRAMVPVNLRPLDEAYKLGNHFGLAPVVLPLGIANPIERVYEVRRRMGELKGSMQPLLAFGLLAVAGLMVKPAQDALLNLFSSKTTAVMTNVPGPREKLRFCGATLEENLFWVPQSGSVGLGISILSYGGGVQFGVVSDSKLCPDPQAIIDGFAPEFDKLSLVTLMLPWGE